MKGDTQKMKKFISVVIALMMIFTLVPAALSASAAEETMTLNCTGGTSNSSHYSYADGTWKIIATTANDTFIRVDIPSVNTIFNTYDVTKLTYSFSGTGVFKTGYGYIYWAPVQSTDSSAMSYNSSSKLASTAPSTYVFRGSPSSWYTVQDGYTFETSDAQMAQIKENKAYYLYIVNKGSNDTAGTLTAQVTITYNTEDGDEATVTLDGSDLEVKDGKVTLPESTDDGFVAYTDGTNNYQPGEVEVSEDTDFSTVAVGKVEMAEGVSIRINTVKGLRYYTNVDKTAIDKATAAGATVSYGTLIGPEDLGLSANNVTDANSVDVSFDSSSVWSEEGFNANGFVGSISNIKDSNRTRAFTGIGYVKVSLNGEDFTVYASNPYSVSLKDAAKSFVTKAESDSTLKTLYDNHTEFFLYAIAD
jgi:hypothetical protein